MFFHPSQAVKYVIKPGQNSLSAASLIIFFDFWGYPIAQNFGFNRNNTCVIVHFYFCLLALIFLAKANFPRHKEAITLSIHPQAWCIFFLSLSDSFFTPSDSFFKRCDFLFYSVVIVYF